MSSASLVPRRAAGETNSHVWQRITRLENHGSQLSMPIEPNIVPFGPSIMPAIPRLPVQHLRVVARTLGGDSGMPR